MNWLLLRGLAREQRHWGRFPEVLRARLPGDGVHCLDLPGTGSEHARQSPGSIRAIAADVRARWLALREQHGGPWSLCAISLGGMVAMQWCGDHPLDFVRAVLINTSAGNLSAPWRRIDLRVLPRVLRTLVSRDALGRQRNMLEMTTRLATNLPELAARWAKVQEESPIRRATVLRQLWAGARFRAPARIEAPVLVLAGARDPFTDPGCPKKVAAHFGARLEVHPDAGHDLPLDAPDWVAERIADWARA
jgi:pimeloyl-ACP methyl ester carboxylesterase